MIIRTGRRIPGVPPVAGVHHPIAVVRMAVEDAYGAEEGRSAEDGDEVAFRTERVAPLRLPRGRGVLVRDRRAHARARVRRARSGPSAPCTRGCSRRRWTPPPRAHPDVPYQPQLIDVTYAGLVGGAAADAPLVIPALNRDGDSLSELVLRLFGSIAGAESVLLAFDEEYRTERRDDRGAARHGAGARGQEHRQPDGDDPRGRGAAALRRRGGGMPAAAAGVARAIYEAVLEAAASGVRTPDLGGHATTIGVHRRGDRARADEARDLVEPRG